MYLVMPVGAVVAVLAVGAHQVSAGRCDPRRHHRALSGALWPVLLVLVILDVIGVTNIFTFINPAR